MSKQICLNIRLEMVNKISNKMIKWTIKKVKTLIFRKSKKLNK